MADPNAPPADQPAVYPPLTDEKSAYPPEVTQQTPYPPQQDPYPPQQGVAPPPPQQQATTTVVVAQQPAVASVVLFRDVPVIITDSAGNQVQTQLQYKAGMMTYVIALVLFVLGFWCCCCIPFCIDGTKDVYHINPTDGSVAGVYKKFG